MKTTHKTLVAFVAIFGISLIAAPVEAQFGGRPAPVQRPVVISTKPLPGPNSGWNGNNFNGSGNGWGNGGHGVQNRVTSPFSGTTYTTFNSATRGPIIIKTDQFGNRSWRGANEPAGFWRQGAF